MKPFSQVIVRAGFFATALVLGTVGASAAPITWQVQADFNGTTTRSLRGIALSPDGSSEYLGFIQGTSGTSAVRNYSSAILSPTNPTSLGSVSLSGSQPKGVAVDDRGDVYATQSNGSGATTEKFGVYSSGLSLLGTGTLSDSTSFQLGGIAVVHLGSEYYAYVGTNKGTAKIERWDVTNPASPTLDTSWGSSGIVNLKTITGGGTNAAVNGLDVGPDGTVYAAGVLTSPTARGDELYEINPGGTAIVAETPVTLAMDVALFNNQLYVDEYNGSSSLIDILNASDLSTAGTLTTGFSDAGAAGTDEGYSGIAINSAGNIYVSDQVYNNNTSNTDDRVLVSSAVPEPAGAALLIAGGAITFLRRRRK